jgi:hypothetical protein
MHGDAYNRVIGTDTRLLLGSRYVFNGQIATSFTGGTGTTSHWKPLFDFTLTRTGREAGFNFVVEGRHPEFNAASGFIARPGIAHANFTPRRTFFPRTACSRRLVHTDPGWHVGLGPLHGRAPSRTTSRSTAARTARCAAAGARRLHVAGVVQVSPQLYTNYYIERRDDAGAVTDTVRYTGTTGCPTTA